MKKINFHYYEIKGLNQERFFNNLSKKYSIYELNRFEKSRAEFKVSFFDGEKVKKEILAAGYQILNEKKGGIFFIFSKLLKSYGLLLGIAAVFVSYFVQMPFVQRIEVWGSQNASEIKKFVDDEISSRQKSKINTKALEQKIMAHFDNLTFVSVAILGQSLIVNVKSGIRPPEMDETFLPIVSQYDGVVTKIELVQGTVLVQVGDIIQKGQILVAGYVENAQGQTLNLPPKANIYIDVWVQASETHYDEKVVTRRTGNKIECCSVWLNSQQFYSNGKQNSFSCFEIESSEQILCKNNILPFVLKRDVYYETVSEKIVSSFEDEKDFIINSAREKCLQNIGESEIIKKEDVLILEGAGFTTVKYIITANILVSGEDESLHEQA